MLAAKRYRGGCKLKICYKRNTLVTLCQRRYANESSRKMQTRSTGM
ncbi:MULTISPECIES: hypothetical protein [unclassified Wolbachia]